MAAPLLGTGASFTYGTANAYSSPLEIMSISLDNAFERESIKTSHLGTTGGHTFIPSTLYDAGGCTLTFQTDDAGVFSTYAVTSASALTITFASGMVFTASAFITSHSFSAELETLQTGTVTFKFTGALSHD
jgi:hypothetical protein